MKKKNIILISIVSVLVVAAAVISAIFIVKHNKNKNTFINADGRKQKYVVDASGNPVTNEDGKYAVTVTDKHGKTPTNPDKTPATEYIEKAVAEAGGTAFETKELKFTAPKDFKNTRAAGEEGGNYFSNGKCDIILRSYLNKSFDEVVDKYRNSVKDNVSESELTNSEGLKFKTFESSFESNEQNEKKENITKKYKMTVCYTEVKGKPYSIAFIAENIDLDYIKEMLNNIQAK